MVKKKKLSAIDIVAIESERRFASDKCYKTYSSMNTKKYLKRKGLTFNQREILRLLKQHELGNLKNSQYRELADRINHEPSIRKLKKVI